MKTGLISKLLIALEIILIVATAIVILATSTGLLNGKDLLILVPLFIMFVLILALLAIIDIRKSKEKRTFRIVYMLPTLIYVIIMAVIYFI